MATASVTNTFVVSTTIDEGDVNTNFNDLVTFLNGSVVHRDGSKTMTGDLDLNGNDINNVPWKSTWAPTYTNMTIGNGTVVARHLQLGDLVAVRFRFDLGSTSGIGVEPTVSVPVTASTTGIDANGPSIGRAGFKEAGGTNYQGHLFLSTSTAMIVTVSDSSGAYVVTAQPTNSVPFTWGTSDVLSFAGIYEAA